MKRLLPTSLCAALSCALFYGALAHGSSPEEVAALVKGGATQLALGMLDVEQTPGMAPEQWAHWERQRLAVLKALHRWDDLARRVDTLPPDTPDEFRREAVETAAEARLAANDPDGARRYLRELLWQERVEGETAARVRRLVIRSYLEQNRLDDARVALQRYQQDYQAKSAPWQQLKAEILLQSDEPRAAVNAVAGLQTYEARLLRLAGMLRAKMQSPRNVLSAANKMADGLTAHPELRRASWVLAAEAAHAAGDGASYVLALERALSLPDNDASELFRARADDLWRAYDEYAEQKGNAAKLLVGNDDAWLDKAETVACTENHIARALYAFLSRHAADVEVRTLSHQRLAAGLMRDGHSRTLEMLYTQSSRYPDVADIPPVVRYALADKAIADYNIDLAAKLVQGLDTPPEGEPAEDWALRRARILVYAGDYPTAVGLLDGVLQARERLDAGLTGRLLQVLFDLQAVNHHQDAARLLQAVYDKLDSDKLRRELLFWMADSQAALKHYQVAAELYLRSASFGGANSGDPWGLTARYHAAEALGHAGLIDDARRVYLKLMEVTPDPRRRAEIERQIQQLWLNRNAASTP